MKITQENYQAYFLDYIEGNLTSGQREEVADFLRLNPELENELADFDEIKLNDSAIVYTSKNELKKSPIEFDGSYFDYLCISKIEGSISLNETKELNLILKNEPTKKHDLSVYKNSILKSDATLVFDAKKTLKRPFIFATIKPGLYKALSLAALLVLFLGVPFFFYSENYNTVTTAIAPLSYSGFQLKRNTVNKVPSTIKLPVIYAHKQIPTSNSINKLNRNESILVSVTIKKDSSAKIAVPEKISIKNTPYLAMNNPDKVPLTLFTTKLAPPVEQYENYPLIAEYLQNKLKKSILKSNETERFSFAAVGNFILKGISKLTGKNIELKRKYNNNGELKEFAVNAGKYEFYIISQ